MASKHIVHGCNYLPPMPYLTPEQSQEHPVTHSTHSTHTQTTSRTQAQNLIMKLILFHWKRNTQQAKREKRAENREQKAKGQANIKPLNIDGQ